MREKTKNNTVLCQYLNNDSGMRSRKNSELSSEVVFSITFKMNTPRQFELQ